MTLELRSSPDEASLWHFATGELPLRAAVTTRFGGNSKDTFKSLNFGLHVGDDPKRVIENRQRALTAFGDSCGNLVLAEQTHSSNAVVVAGSDRGRGSTNHLSAIEDCDALVTKEPGLVLAIQSADCVPILLFDPVAEVLALVHAGWRGIAGSDGSGILTAAIERMVGLGAKPAQLLASLGPSVAQEHYEVGEEVVNALIASVGEIPAGAIDRSEGKPRANCAAFVVTQLQELGIPELSISRPAIATGSPGPFFSDRENRPCGRLALLAVLGQTKPTSLPS
ncbi:MAG: polyphenol oxidase family protein [Actinomycetes bacterium]